MSLSMAPIKRHHVDQWLYVQLMHKTIKKTLTAPLSEQH